MKKILIIILIFISIISNTSASDYKLTNSDKKVVNKLSFKIQNLLNKQSLGFRANLTKKINTLQKKFKTNKKIVAIFEQIKINTYLVSNKQEYTKHYKQFNIDYNKVNLAWLGWHNKARVELGLSPYSIDSRLNDTAFEWSKKQSADGIMYHKRDKGDPFYDYPKIEKWFNVRGVKCKVKGRTTSSESIGKYGYYCNKANCTDELLVSLKEIFTIYMAEKGLSYPANAHYKGIISPNLSKMGLGIYIKENFTDRYENYRSYDYYVTTHYCTEFKK